MGFLTKEQVRASKVKFEKVEAFGGEVWVKELSAQEREDARLEVGNKEGEIDVAKTQIAIVRRAVCGVDKKRLFNEEEDLSWLLEKSAKDLEIVSYAAQRLSGLAPEEDTKLVKK